MLHRKTIASALDGNGTAIRKGMRVEIAPHYDLWMRGARFGTVTRVYHVESRRLDPKDSLDRDMLAIRMDHPQVKRLAHIPAYDSTVRR